MTASADWRHSDALNGSAWGHCKEIEIMSKTTKGAIGLFVAFVLGCASAPLVVPVLSAQATAAGAVRWEYNCYGDMGSANVDTLNEHGAQGWELVSINGTEYCFKRPL